jgi:hypothetical protein
MLLTAQMFEDIVRSLRADLRTASDRRRYPRVGLRAKLNIVPLDQHRQPAPQCCVGVRDLSAGGFGLIVQQPLELGQLFVARLERRGDEEPLSILCEVVQRYSNDRIGSRIVRTLNPTEQAKAPAKTSVACSAATADLTA